MTGEQDWKGNRSEIKKQKERPKRVEGEEKKEREREKRSNHSETQEKKIERTQEVLSLDQTVQYNRKIN